MTPSAHNIADLLARVSRKDASAFDALYDATNSKLYGIVLRIIRRRDISDEVLQEVYVKIWERAADFDPGRASPITWMATIARNRALDEIRRRVPVSIEDTPEALDVPSPDAQPLRALEMSQDVQRLNACLDKLDPQRRQLVIEAYIQGATREELSHRLGAPVSTIKTWLHRSLAQLKACLTP
jgi:RNA polymerase sigma-70 factor, ECF subfamily